MRVHRRKQTTPHFAAQIPDAILASGRSRGLKKICFADHKLPPGLAIAAPDHHADIVNLHPVI
jgi:hypothetical protein